MVLTIVKSNSVHSVAQQTFLCEAERRIRFIRFILREGRNILDRIPNSEFSKKIFSKFCKDTQISQDDITITRIQTTI